MTKEVKGCRCYFEQKHRCILPKHKDGVHVVKGVSYPENFVHVSEADLSAFYECEDCSAKSGAPRLCAHCIKARKKAGRFWRGMRRAFVAPEGQQERFARLCEMFACDLLNADLKELPERDGMIRGARRCASMIRAATKQPC